MTLNGRRQFWADRIAAQRASGQNIKDWCATHHINRRQFHYWIRNLETLSSKNTPKAPRSHWVEVNVEHSEVTASAIVVQVGAAAIEIKPGFNSSLLAEVIRTLQTVC
jgi:hypothetical protein